MTDPWRFLQEDHYNKVINSAKECIELYGTLRWCSGGICACMGCANRFMSENDYHEALSLPEIQKLIKIPKQLNIRDIIKHLKPLED